MGESKTTTTLFVLILALIVSMGIEIYNHPSEYNLDWLDEDQQHQKDKLYTYEKESDGGGFWVSLTSGVNTVVDTIGSTSKIIQLFGRALLRSILPYSVQLGVLETQIEIMIAGILQFFQLGIGLVQGITIWRIFRRD